MRDVILLSLSSELDVVVVVVAAVAVAADGDATTCVNSHGSTKLPPLLATTSAPRPSSGEFIATNHSFAAPWQIASLACPRGQQHGSPAMCRPAGVCPRARANTWQHKAASVEDSPAWPPSVGQVQARKSRNRMNLISILSLSLSLFLQRSSRALLSRQPALISMFVRGSRRRRRFFECRRTRKSILGL